MNPLYEELLPGGAMWSMRLPQARAIRLTALGSGANLSALFYNALNPIDRLNIPDTLKALHTAKLTRGHILMSDMGNALASITEDSLGWHDPLGGHSTAAMVETAFGAKSYQSARNDFHRNAHDNFLVELAKWGLGLPDLVANVNFFSKVTADDTGRLAFIPDHCPEGASLTLRTEIPVIAVLANCPHPMHPPGEYPRVPVRLELLTSPPPGPDDFCRNFRPECARTLELAARHLLQTNNQ
ncbi:MAG: urea amidolyase associated protein UAAP1 [Terrimicrobiaceae bacterium]